MIRKASETKTHEPGKKRVTFGEVTVYQLEYIEELSPITSKHETMSEEDYDTEDESTNSLRINWHSVPLNSRYGEQ